MKKGLILIIIVICLFALNGCWVCDRFYFPLTQNEFGNGSFKDSILEIRCAMRGGEKHELSLELTINSRDSMHIESVAFSLTSNGRTIPISGISMYNNKHNLPYMNIRSPFKSEFQELPEIYRCTGIRGEPNIYIFYFEDKKKSFNSKYLELKMDLILKNQPRNISLSRQFSLKKFKSCTFLRMH